MWPANFRPVGLPKADAATMILVQCAACAAPLGLALGKKCGRCSTRYCGPACQEQHWKEGGHDTLCKKIKKAGGAEQYNANQKYTAAVTVAAEACADDTTATARASVYLLFALYCSAPPAFFMLLQSLSCPPSFQCCTWHSGPQ